MILAQDEMTIQRMLGCNEIPQDIHDEYLRRIRFLHRETSGGPMGPGMIVDLLRFMGCEPAVSGSDNPAMVDWREVERGTRVKVRRAGRWTANDVVCRFEGFVDMGTLAVELPTGRVDEFNKCDVRILAINENPGIVPDKVEQGSMQDGKVEPDARIELEPEVEPEPEQSPTDNLSPVTEPELPELTEYSPELYGASRSSWPPAPVWKELQPFTAVWVRETIGEGRDAEVDIHDAKFVSRIPGGKIKVRMVVGEGDNIEEIERVFPQDDVRVPEVG